MPMGITAMILTFNEAPNIQRTLEKLAWAADIVVVDSGSTDGTLEILKSFPRVRVFTRRFDSFAAQCNYGLQQVRTDWVLSLDADYVLTDELVTELGTLDSSVALQATRHGSCIAFMDDRCARRCIPRAPCCTAAPWQLTGMTGMVTK